MKWLISWYLSFFLRLACKVFYTRERGNGYILELDSSIYWRYINCTSITWLMSLWNLIKNTICIGVWISKLQHKWMLWIAFKFIMSLVLTNSLLYLHANAPKFSRHLVIRIQKTAFKDNSHVGAFVTEVCLGDQRWQELFVDTAGLRRSQLFVDTAVYTRNPCFRLFLSTKAGKIEFSASTCLALQS